MATGLRVIKNFIKRGFRLLGDGCYAAVFESNTDPNLVYKIGNTVQDPYLDYINANIASKHFPRIHKTYIDYENNYYLVIMERLDPLPVHKRKTLTLDLLEQFTGDKQTSCAMLEVVEHVNKLLNEFGAIKLDLHSENIMMRGINPVITDPLSHDEIEDSYDLSIWMSKHGDSLQKVVRA
jgi:hypothetical protein